MNNAFLLYSLLLYSLFLYSLHFSTLWWMTVSCTFPLVKPPIHNSLSSSLSANDPAYHPLTENLRWELPQATTIMSVCKFWSSLRTPSKATANPSTCAQTGVGKPHACAVYGSFMLQKQSWVAVTDSTAHKAYNTIQPFKEKLAQPCTRWSPLLSSNTDTAGWSAQWVLSRRNALRPTQDTEDMRDTDWWPRKDLNRLRSRKKDEEDERA